MASLKIHEQCKVCPPSETATPLSLPLTFFDLNMLFLTPIELIFFYSLPPTHSDLSFFIDKVTPRLKASLSLTLQHFLPLAGNIIWPSDSQKPIIQFKPDNNDGVSFVLAQCNDANFNKILEHGLPLEAIQSRSFLPHLESNESFASIISFQITLFPNSGFSIGISAHHGVFDGKSLTMFIKAWASLCKTEENPTLDTKLKPIFNNEIVKHLSNFTEIVPKHMLNEKGRINKRSLKITEIHPKLEDSVRATFELKHEDLDKIKKRVLAKWDEFDEGVSKPKTLSSFIVTCAYVIVCIAKAIQGVERERNKFAFGFPVDFRTRLEPPIPSNYFGNCISGIFIDSQPCDFIKEEGFFFVAKSIYEKIIMIDKNEVFVGTVDGFDELITLISQGIEIMGVSMSNKFGVYESDFGWGKPSKIEILGVDKMLGFGLIESRDESGGVEIGLVLNKHMMDLFTTLFRKGLTMHN